MNKKQYYTALLIMEPAMLVAAFLILFFSGKPLFSWYVNHYPLVFQALIGGVAAIPLAFIFIFIGLRIRFFSDVRDIFEKLFKSARLNTFDIAVTSVMAGVFEEILFRGVLQPFLGLWLTSFIFILLHGYFNPKSLNMTVTGILAFGLSCVIGVFFERFGIISAISLHTVYDFLALYIMMRHFKAD